MSKKSKAMVDQCDMPLDLESMDGFRDLPEHHECQFDTGDGDEQTSSCKVVDSGGFVAGKKRKPSGKSGWPKYNAKRAEIRAKAKARKKRRKEGILVPFFRLTGKQPLNIARLSGSGRVKHFNVKRIEQSESDSHSHCADLDKNYLKAQQIQQRFGNSNLSKETLNHHQECEGGEVEEEMEEYQGAKVKVEMEKTGEAVKSESESVDLNLLLTHRTLEEYFADDESDKCEKVVKKIKLCQGSRTSRIT